MQNNEEPVTNEVNGITVGANNLPIGSDMLMYGIANGNLSDIDMVAVNLATIVRNSIEARVKDTADSMNAALDASTATITSLTHAIKLVNKKSVFYNVPPKYYMGLKTIKNAKFKVPTTALQASKLSAEIKLTKALLDKLPELNINLVNSHPGNGKIALATHNPLDLIHYDTAAVLIESHTGKVKRIHELNSKLNLSKSQRITIPFNALTCLIFGEKHFVSPISREIKALVLSASVKLKWSSTTTMNRIRVSLSTREKDTYDKIKPFL